MIATTEELAEQGTRRKGADLMRVLVICTGNSARSQMAEGLFRHLGGEQVSVHSAGSEPASEVHPLAVQVMAEIGIDLSDHRPKSLAGFLGQPFDAVIAVCSHAAGACPTFPGPAERIDWFYEDPAAAEGAAGEQMAAFRSVRDALKQRIRDWLSEVA